MRTGSDISSCTKRYCTHEEIAKEIGIQEEGKEGALVFLRWISHHDAR
jgi:hypothetical protein